MKKENILYYLSVSVCIIFSSLFFIDLFIMGIFYVLDIDINTFLGYLFFFLLGLWLGSATTLAATHYMKKKYQKDLKD